jgi:riboflavin biosynthesis pyrimidine reductase
MEQIMRALIIAGLLLMFGLNAALADNPTLTVSTNNTPSTARPWSSSLKRASAASAST